MDVLTEQQSPVDGNGRLARMVRWLIDNRDRVDRPNKVQVTFDCAGRSVVVELKEREKIESQ